MLLGGISESDYLGTPAGSSILGGVQFNAQQPQDIAYILANTQQPVEPESILPKQPILARYPDATAQVPNFPMQGYQPGNRINRVVSDAGVGQLGKPVGGTQRTPTVDNSLSQTIAQSPAQIQRLPQGGVMDTQQLNPLPQYPQQQQQPRQYTPQEVMQWVSEHPELFPQQQVVSPYVDTARQQNAYIQQQAISQYGTRQPEPPSAARYGMGVPGLGGIGQRFGALIANGGRRGMYANQALEAHGYAARMKAWDQQRREALQIMQSANSTAYGHEMQLAEKYMDFAKAPTLENQFKAGLALTEAIPEPGEARDVAIQAAEAYRLDLRPWAKVINVSAITKQDKRKADLAGKAIDNEVKTATKDDKISKSHISANIAKVTQGTVIKYRSARADLAELDMELKKNFGRPLMEAALKRQQQIITNDASANRNQALSKINAFLGQYTARLNQLNLLTTKERAKQMPAIYAQFGQPDVNGVPKDIMDARNVQSELMGDMVDHANGQSGVPAQQPASGLQPPPAPRPPLTTQLKQGFVNQAAVEGLKGQAALTRAQELARQAGY